VRERDSTMPHARVGRGRRTVWFEEDVLDIVYTITHSQHWSHFLCSRTLSGCGMVYYTWDSVVPFPCVRRFCNQENSASNSCDLCHKRLWTPLSFCVVLYTDEAVFTRQHTQLAWMGNAESSCYSSLVISENIKKTELTAWRCADHATPSIRKSWH
jgi:hypothetical protein